MSLKSGECDLFERLESKFWTYKRVIVTVILLSVSASYRHLNMDTSMHPIAI